MGEVLGKTSEHPPDRGVCGLWLGAGARADWCVGDRGDDGR